MKHHTIGSVIASGQVLQVYCEACKTVSIIDPRGDFYGPKVELPVLEKTMPCPACRRHNQPGFTPVSVRAVEQNG